MKQYLGEAIRKGGYAAKQNLWPAIVLQVLAVALIFGYYNVSVVRSSLDRVGALNVGWSPWFAVMMTMVFAGVIPLTVEAFRAKFKGNSQRSIAQVVFTLLVWAMNGLITDRFYVLQSKVFGDELSFLTVLKKVLVDQFIWVPIYAVPVFTIAFLWRDSGFRGSILKERLERKSFLERALPLMISNWAVWIPAVSVIYSFPLSLQLILMNLILVFWSLILTFFVADEG